MWYFITFMAGGMFGVFIMCLMFIAKESDGYERKKSKI